MARDLIQARLNDLIETARCGQNGFSEAARCACAPQIRTLFKRCSSECAISKAELQTWIEIFSEAPNQIVIPPRETPQPWRELGNTQACDDDLNLLEICQHGQEIAFHSYARVLELPILPELRYLLLRQQERAQRHCERIGRFRVHSLQAAH